MWFRDDASREFPGSSGRPLLRFVASGSLSPAPAGRLERDWTGDFIEVAADDAAERDDEPGRIAVCCRGEP